MNVVRAIIVHLSRHTSYSEINRATGASRGFISKVACQTKVLVTPKTNEN